MDKKKYDVSIADVEMSIISDEREEFVMKLVEKLDSEVRDILQHSKRSTKVDAALLLALDYSCGKAKAEKRVRNLEAQIALYDANLRRMREENIKLRSALLGSKDAPADVTSSATADSTAEVTAEPDEAKDAETPVQVAISESDNRAEEKETVSQLTIGAEPETAAPASGTREDKLRQIGQIADLLRKKDN
ncbi:MAG: cell division protein ZapA [Clostridia bacterium]|nr:cell division protein ZapA [Clostridia bacterium]